MNDSHKDMVRQLADIRLLVIGDAVLDHYVVGTVDRISPEAPVPIVHAHKEYDRLGGAANVAANATSLGSATTLVALTGDDTDRQRLEARCRESAIMPALLPLLDATVRKTRVIASGQQLLRIDFEYPFGSTGGEPAFILSSAGRKERQQLIEKSLPDCDMILVSDYAKGMIDAQVMEQVLASGREVLVDPRPQHTELYRGVTMITPNLKEATQMLGLAVPLPPRETGLRLAEKLDCNILLTLGGEGMCLVTRQEEIEEIPTLAREVFDVTGAGDTVAAIMAIGIGAKLNLSDAAHLANAAAGLVVAHIGTASVTPDELCAAL